jgi:hypothetical protein
VQDFLLFGIGTGDVLSKTVGILRSRQAFGVWEIHRFKGSYAGKSDFDDMDAICFTKGRTFMGGGINFRTAPEEPSVAANFGIPELKEREARGVVGIRHCSAPRSSLGAIPANAESAKV